MKNVEGNSLFSQHSTLFPQWIVKVVNSLDQDQSNKTLFIIWTQNWQKNL